MAAHKEALRNAIPKIPVTSIHMERFTANDDAEATGHGCAVASLIDRFVKGDPNHHLYDVCMNGAARGGAVPCGGVRHATHAPTHPQTPPTHARHLCTYAPMASARTHSTPPRSPAAPPERGARAGAREQRDARRAAVCDGRDGR